MGPDMLKMLGVDPRGIERFADALAEKVKSFDARLLAIEAGLVRIEARLEECDEREG